MINEQQPLSPDNTERLPVTEEQMARLCGLAVCGFAVIIRPSTDRLDVLIQDGWNIGGGREIDLSGAVTRDTGMPVFACRPL